MIKAWGWVKTARLLFIVFLPVAGCAPMAEIDIRVMDPAEIALPVNTRQIAFLNRSIHPSLLLHPDYSKWNKKELYILDTIMSKGVFRGVRKFMHESPLFNLDSIQLLQAWRFDTTNRSIPLSVEQLLELKELHPADILFSLEYYDLNDSLRVIRKYTEQGPLDEAYRGIYTTTLWRIYDLHRDTVFDEYILRDTLTWYKYAESFEAAVGLLPKTGNVIRNAALNIGLLYGKRISPVWLDAPRFYYISGGKEMRTASRKAGNGEWTDAAKIWKKLAYEDDQKTAAKACFNMALVCEMEDLMIPAMDWAVKSYFIRQESLTKEYIDLLKLRYQERGHLEKQLL